MKFNEAVKELNEHDQEHVLKYYKNLSEKEKERLLNQIEELDYDMLSLIKHKSKDTEIGKIMPIKTLSLEDINKNKDKFFNEGKKAVKEGKVACVLLAGGMGTRLGLDKPKGELNIGLTKEIFLFEKLIENLTKVKEETKSKSIQLYIMTSEKNNDETKSFFKVHNYFGYPEEDIEFFEQDMAPSVDFTGKLLMEDKGLLSMSPNGNGGWFSSMKKSGIVKKLKNNHIEWINIFSVDNPLQKMADPIFIGAAILKNADSASKVVKKAYPEEKMGVMCLENNCPSVIEYYEMSDDMINKRDDKGDLLYGYGVILNYIFRLDKLEEIDSKKLPYHIVEKKIPYINEIGEYIKPKEPNGYKFEALVVDMIRNFDNCLPFEVIREKEFAPIKNLKGKDSLDSSRELLIKNGVKL